VKILLIIIWILFVVACKKNTVSEAVPPEITTDLKDTGSSRPRPLETISLSEIAIGPCMSLALLVDRLSDPMFDYPSSLMTTDFKILDSGISGNNAKFVAHSAFYYKMGPASSLVPFPKVIQGDCKKIQIRTASEQLLTFNILDSSDRYLKFQLVKEFEDDVLVYQREALFNRYQPDEFSVYVNSETEIKITKKIKNFDSLCKKKKKGFELQMTEVFSWKRDPNDLPKDYLIEKGYLNLVLSALTTPPKVNEDESLPVATIQEISRSLLVEEIKICN
jgi:hypothetical protein